MDMRIKLLIFLSIIGTVLAGQPTLNIYVSSRNTDSIKRYAWDGTYLGDFVAPKAGGLGKPQDLFFHPEQNILLVTGIENESILQYDATTGEFLGPFSKGYRLDHPTKMRIGPDGMIYVSQWGENQNRIARFGLDGQFVDEFTATGVPNACGLSWDQEGQLYVSSYADGRSGAVHRFDTTGRFLGIFSDSLHLKGPVGLWQDQDQDWLVTDWTSGKVERFNQDGVYQSTFIEGLTRLEGHTFDAQGNIYLCDWQENVINRYHPDGNLHSRLISTGGLKAPNSILIAPAPGS